MNQHVVALLKRLENRYSIDSLDMSMSSWIETNTMLRKRPFSFADYHFQRAIVDDLHPNLDVKKISQVGMTEIEIRKLLGFLMRNAGTKGIFTLPNEKMYKRVSKTRIQPTIEGSPVFCPEGYKDWTRSMDLIQFDQSFLYVTGATEGDATSIDADFVANDEVDLTNQAMLALFQSRMQNSRHKINQRFSTPTHVGFGIDKSFSTSDQREFMCRCYACNHWNIPEFNRTFIHLPGLPDEINKFDEITLQIREKLDIDNAFVKCEKCGAPLDLDNPDFREWVPRFGARSDFAHGYNISPFVSSRLDIRYIVDQLLKYKEREFLRGWYNTVLGQAYTDSTARLSKAEIEANFLQEPPLEIGAHEPCFLGIDVGIICHIVIAKLTSKGLVVCKFLTLPADQLERWVEEFEESHNLIYGALDRFPYTPTANAVFAASKGKVYPVEYRGQKEINPIKDENDEVIYFQANRTLLIDAVVKRVRKGTLPMAGYEKQGHLVVEHLRDMVRDEKPEEEAVWIKLNGNDHYFHALGFLLFATRIETMISLLSEENPRTMAIVLGLDIKPSNDGLSGSNRRRPREGLSLRR